ncbi:MAG: hypothetical protein AB1941_22435 [Gemmatimonadota bacterium]
MRRIATAPAVLALAATLGGCGLGCEDVNRIHAATAAGFGVTEVVAAGTTGAMLYGSADYTQEETGSLPDFDEVFAVLARNSGDSRSLQFTLTGYETPPGDRIVLVLSVPTRAQQGDRFRVTGAFAPPGPWQDEWTFRRAVAPGETEIGFARTRATIPNPPYNYAAVYTATRAAGTVEVLGRDRGRLDLRVDLTATDDAGRGYRIAGTVGVTAGKEGEACFTLS